MTSDQNKANLATADLFQAEIARLQAENELLAAAGKASHSAMLVIDSGFQNALAEIERLRLTDAEREAVEAMAHWCEVDCGYCRDADEQRAADHYAARAATLRGLLERTK